MNGSCIMRDRKEEMGIFFYKLPSTTHEVMWCSLKVDLGQLFMDVAKFIEHLVQ